MSSTPGSNPQGFRPDIQGLRAVAVLAVVAFHAGLPVPGGFIGVDIFFVISGFVITMMLLRVWSREGSISLTTFGRRRFFRLTPALALVVGATFVASALFLFPGEQRITLQTGLGALLLVANIVIARTTGGYFDAPAERNPLLNTWSLSVEEQFYLVFPLLLVTTLVIARRFPRWRLTPVVALGAAALAALAVTAWALTPAAQGLTWLNFYSPITRSWEFAAGALLALTLGSRHVPSRVSSVLWWAGMVGIGLSLFVITSSTPFPGPWTLLPVFSTVAVIAGGNPERGTVPLLTLRPMTKIGDWSYSIYLWHWPMIVMAIAFGITSGAGLILVAIASVVPALVSYRFVELPLRNWTPSRPTRRLPVAAGILATPVVIGVVLLAVLPQEPRYQGTTGTAYLTTIETTSFPCPFDVIPGSGARCYQSQENRSPDVVIVGDSHAEHLYLGLRDQLPDSAVAYMYLPNWPYDVSTQSNLAFQQISSSDSIQAVVVNSRWDAEGATTSQVRGTIDELARSRPAVFIADDGPTFSFHAEECQFERRVGPASRCVEDSSSFSTRYAQYRPALDQLAVGHQNVHVLHTAEGLCTNTECSMIRGDELLFADHGHFNEIGSNRVFERLLDEDSDFRASVLP